MIDNKKFPYLIHSLDPAGVSVLTSARSAITAESTVLYPGDSIEIDEETYELTKDRNGVSWLDKPSSRWGFGPVPAEVAARVKADKYAEKIRERAEYLQRNPHARKQAGVATRLGQLSAEIAELED